MRIYQTGKLSGKQADEFISAFDSAIGTETETNEHESGVFEVSCFELTAGEVARCRRFEAAVIAEYPR